MAKGKVQISQKSIFSLSFETILETFWSFLPHLIRSPLKAINFGLRCFNQITELSLFIILIGQTVHILHNSQKRVINLRHLLIKWLIYLLVLILMDQVKHQTIFDQFFILFCNAIAAIMVYPSKFIKNLHLKYFSYNQKKKYDQSLDDPSQVDLTLTTKILVSLSILFLNASRLLITFVPLNQRRKIQDALKEVNLTIVQEKYFGKIYDLKSSKVPSTLNQPNLAELTAESFVKSRQSSKTQKKIDKEKNGNVIKMKVEENIEINLGSIISNQQGNRNFAFYRQIQIYYNSQTTELTIKNLQDERVTTQMLAEVVIVDDVRIQLIFQDEESSIFVKFKSKKDKELFINYIYLGS